MEEIFINTIDWNATIWRYYKTDRFLDLINTKRIHFAASSDFDDPFEGSVEIINPRRKYILEDSAFSRLNNAFKELQRLTKISCWNQYEYENDGMWKLYANAKKGIAITTTPKKFKQSIKEYRIQPSFVCEQVYIGKIKYLDLTKNKLNVSMLERFCYKHISFSWENEIRFIIPLRIAEEFGVNVPKNGIFVDVDILSMIDKIIIGPEIDKKEKKIIMQCCKDNNLERRIKLSSMMYLPKFV